MLALPETVGYSVRTVKRNGRATTLAIAYYNENDPYAAEYLRNLIDAKLIAPGAVDERSIEDVRPSDLNGFSQCHFFAGVGIWSLALRNAGWPDSRPVWTGSCPCQPFSAAGKGAGFDDERHLWPSWYWLIEQCKPANIFGEQVASKAVEPWIDLVQADLEAMGYTFGCVPFPSAGVGAPHIRDRAYWVGHSRSEGLPARQRAALESTWRGEEGRAAEQSGGALGGVGNTPSVRCQRQCRGGGKEKQGAAQPSQVDWSRPTNGFWSDPDWLYCRDGKWRPVEPGTSPLAHGAPARVGRLRAYGNGINAVQAAEFIKATMTGPAPCKC